jgi:hypothetical protein
MKGEYGIFEHARYDKPRPSHGYCTDDMARLLVITSREVDPGSLAITMSHDALRFVVDAQNEKGEVRNRRDRSGRWQDAFGAEDCWGRSLWAFGTAVAHHPDETVREMSLICFELSASLFSPWPRSMAYAAIGAYEVLQAHPDHSGAMKLLANAEEIIGVLGSEPSWPWPEPRLTYANAVIPEAMILAGHALGHQKVMEDGFLLLAWLLDREMGQGHLSVTPTCGRGPNDAQPAFDQQPIEVATMADACARAVAISACHALPIDVWISGVASSAAWFLGENDAHAPMWDPESGGGYDGLEASGPNLNMGTESTLSVISTFQHAQRQSLTY